MRPLLDNDNVFIRFVGLYSLGLLLFFGVWLISYTLLPEGIIRGISILGKLAGETAAETIFQEIRTILGLNLISWAFILLGNYVLRVDYFSYGYLIPLAWMIMYAITLGTNSFSIQMEAKMALSLSVFQRSGLWEMMAACLFAVATDSISANKSASILQESIPILKENRPPFKKEQWIAVIISLSILILAAIREAYMIIGA
ncbi:MAG: hypothetical protein NWF07_06015 [Candidatus Bathyarchaeota archaeon]|nr:hypothetical protein [Candidatus Bathyarchaeota archaeon]